MTLRLHFYTSTEFITGPVIDEAHHLPDFMVISGRNGAGKTQLLQALRDGGTKAKADDISIDESLNVAEFAEPPASPYPGSLPINEMDRKSALEQIRMNIRVTIGQFTGGGIMSRPDGSTLRAAIPRVLETASLITQTGLAKAETNAGKQIQDWDDEDFDRFLPLELGVTSPFALSVDRLFRTYSDQWTRNSFGHWRVAQGDAADASLLSEAEFTSQFGPKPWELLTEAMSKLDLRYAFDAPRYLPGDHPRSSAT